MLIKLLRITFFSILALLLLALFGIWFFGAQILAYYKPKLEKAISDQTGFSVTFDSGSLKLYPYLGVTLKNGKASSVAGCTPWEVAEASLRVEIRPLLHRRIDIRRIDIQGVQGSLRIAAGQVSLSDANGKACVAAQAPVSVASPQSVSTPSPSVQITRLLGYPISINLDLLQLRAVNLHFFDAQKEHDLIIDNAEAVVHADEDGKG